MCVWANIFILKEPVLYSFCFTFCNLFQLPHGLPPTCLDLKTEVEKRFLRDPAWLPVHDVDDAFHKFLKYEMKRIHKIALVFVTCISYF